MRRGREGERGKQGGSYGLFSKNLPHSLDLFWFPLKKWTLPSRWPVGHIPSSSEMKLYLAYSVSPFVLQHTVTVMKLIFVGMFCFSRQARCLHSLLVLQ